MIDFWPETCACILDSPSDLSVCLSDCFVCMFVCVCVCVCVRACVRVCRFVMFVPTANCAAVTLHTVHPPPHLAVAAESERRQLHRFLSDTGRCDIFHSVATTMSFSFPERRLIQYDCGEFSMHCSAVNFIPAEHSIEVV